MEYVPKKENMMISRLKQYLLIGLLIAAFYFLLSHHIIFSGSANFNLLKKQELTLEYTFYSLNNKKMIDILRNEKLRDAGIEDVLLDKGYISEERLNLLLRKIDNTK
jgi:hypothetical protein